MRGLGALYMTPAAIQGYAENAGFFGSDLGIAVAIALAESSGNPNAYNPETAAGTRVGMGSYGLWQIYLQAHPEFAGVNLYDPQTNANAAYHVYAESGGFSPWATYTSGAYQNFMQSVPLTLDAATGLPVDTTTSAAPIDTTPPADGTAPADYTILWILAAAGALFLLLSES